jgi:hypothetical protein
MPLAVLTFLFSVGGVVLIKFLLVEGKERQHERQLKTRSTRETLSH